MARVYSIEKVKNLFTKVSLADQYKLDINVNDKIKNYINNNFSDSQIKTGTTEDIFNRGDSATFSGLDEKVSLMCRSVQVPGTSVEYETLIGSRQGLSEVFPTYRVFNAIDCTFYVDKDHDVLRFFHRWMNMVTPTFKSSGTLQITAPGVDSQRRQPGTSSGVGDQNPANFYKVSYKDDYVCDMKLTKFEKDSFGESNRWKPNKSRDLYNNVSGLEFNIYRAFPVDISSVPLSYDTTDVLQVNVTFEYDRYTVA